MIDDHVAWPGPDHYAWRCRICSQPVDNHVTRWGRWLNRWFG